MKVQITHPLKSSMHHNNPISSHQNNHHSKALQKMMSQYHTHNHLLPNQCTSKLVQEIAAPLPLVWSVVRQFHNPQAYKQFVKSCTMSEGDGGVGSVREVLVVSGLPAKRSTERLDRLDDELHVMAFSMIGGDHRLVNYQSTTTLHEDNVGKSDQTVVIESYVVDIPPESCEVDTCLFADTIIRCNLRSLAKVSERMAREVQVPA